MQGIISIIEYKGIHLESTPVLACQAFGTHLHVGYLSGVTQALCQLGGECLAAAEGVPPPGIGRRPTARRGTLRGSWGGEPFVVAARWQPCIVGDVRDPGGHVGSEQPGKVLVDEVGVYPHQPDTDLAVRGVLVPAKRSKSVLEDRFGDDEPSEKRPKPCDQLRRALTAEADPVTPTVDETDADMPLVLRAL